MSGLDTLLSGLRRWSSSSKSYQVRQKGHTKSDLRSRSRIERGHSTVGARHVRLFTLFTLDAKQSESLQASSYHVCRPRYRCPVPLPSVL